MSLSKNVLGEHLVQTLRCMSTSGRQTASLLTLDCKCSISRTTSSLTCLSGSASCLVANAETSRQRADRRAALLLTALNKESGFFAHPGALLAYLRTIVQRVSAPDAADGAGPLHGGQDGCAECWLASARRSLKSARCKY